jgi:hypothetical protein
MPELFSTARNGEPIVSANGVHLHSRYDPGSEAERFVDALGDQSPYVFLLIEPGFGYLAVALRKRYPRSKILAAHCSPFFSDVMIRPQAYAVEGEWHPTGKISFNRFLEEHIADYEAHSVRILEWKPSIGAYGASALELVSAAAVFLKRAAANHRTTVGFGKKWVRNAFSFGSNVKESALAVPGTGPVAVAASGPGLEDGIDAIRDAQKAGNVFVVSVASAIPALAAGGVRPDLAVATDGGGWAAFHLYEILRSGIPLAVALNATLPSKLYDTPLMIIRDTSCWQKTIVEGTGLPAISIPQRGTVAATAIDLALALTSGDVFLAGFDLGVRRGRTHAKPNALDRFHEDCANRLSPAASAAYGRYVATRDGGTLGIYAEWMAEHLQSGSTRLHVLTGASEALAGIPVVERIQVAPGMKSPVLQRVFRKRTDHSALRKTIADILRRRSALDFLRQREGESALRGFLQGGSCAGELMCLLFPSDVETADAGLKPSGIPRSLLEEWERQLDSALKGLGQERRWTHG